MIRSSTSTTDLATAAPAARTFTKPSEHQRTNLERTKINFGQNFDARGHS